VIKTLLNYTVVFRISVSEFGGLEIVLGD